MNEGKRSIILAEYISYHWIFVTCVRDLITTWKSQKRIFIIIIPSLLIMYRDMDFTNDMFITIRLMWYPKN